MKSLFKTKNAQPQQIEQLTEEQQQTQRMFDRQIVQSTASLQNRDSTRRSGWQKFWGKNVPKPIEDIPKTNSRAVRDMLQSPNTLTEEEAWILRLTQDRSDEEIRDDPQKTDQIKLDGMMESLMETLFLKAAENPMGAAQDVLPVLKTFEGDLLFMQEELNVKGGKEAQNDQKRLDKFLHMVEGYIEHFEQLTKLTNGQLEKRDQDSNGVPVYKLNAEKIDLGRAKGIGDNVKIVKKEYYKTPLFDHKPCIEDIKQGGMGDCYFLAALASAVRTDPEQIMKNMRDNGETVTVRFFRKRTRADAQRDKESPYFQPLKQKGEKDYDSLSPEEKLMLAFHAFQADIGNHLNIGVIINSLHPKWASRTCPQDVSLYNQYLRKIGAEEKIDNNRTEPVEMTVIQCLIAETDIYNKLTEPQGSLQETMGKIEPMWKACSAFIQSKNKNGSKKYQEYCRTDDGGAVVYQEVDVTIRKELDEEEMRDGSTRPLYARGPLWVRLMERAYAASGLNADKKNGFEMDGSKDLLQLDRNYQTAESGVFAHTIFHLTGKKAKQTAIFKADTSDDVKLVSILEKYFNVKGAADLVAALVKRYQLTDQAAAELLRQIREDEQKKDKKSKGETYRVAASGLDDIIRIIVKSKLNLTGGDADDAANINARRELAKKIVEDMANGANNKLQYARFTGQYTKSAENLYDQIRDLIRQGKNVGASSNKFIPDSVNSSGLNGEAMDGGVVQGHAYTVLGVQERGKNRFVVLRNPWAKGETVYHQQKDGSVAVDMEDHAQGVFLMELNDFMRKFYTLDHNL